MKFSVYGLIAVRFLTDDDRNERGLETVRHKVVGKVTAETKENVKEIVKNQIGDFIDTNYPVRWNSEILGLKILAE